MNVDSSCGILGGQIKITRGAGKLSSEELRVQQSSAEGPGDVIAGDGMDRTHSTRPWLGGADWDATDAKCQGSNPTGL